MSEPYFASDEATVYNGDCIEVMRTLPDASVDAVVTDPPYGLEFMGREWDGADGFRRSLNAADAGRESVFGRASRTSPEYRAGRVFQEWCELWASEAARLLKPGGHLLAFGGTRTFHRLASAIEDAGFEIRDSIAWMYGSGFPKSLSVEKAIEAHVTTGGSASRNLRRVEQEGDGEAYMLKGRNNGILGEERTYDRKAFSSSTEKAAAWHGWGTALKPAFEPIVVGRKPLIGSVAANVLAYGTGALNIDAGRIGTEERTNAPAASLGNGVNMEGGKAQISRAATTAVGRWPANVILDDSQATALDEQSGVLTSGKMRAGTQRAPRDGVVYGRLEGDATTRDTVGDSGGASRFFYTAKAGADERPNVDGVQHPTVKPLDLMQWLVRLVTPRGGVVLEPFAGSGTTVEACIREGLCCIAIEREEIYLPLIVQRLDKPHAVGFDFGDWDGAA